MTVFFTNDLNILGQSRPRQRWCLENRHGARFADKQDYKEQASKKLLHIDPTKPQDTARMLASSRPGFPSLSCWISAVPG
jgi:hypothetical protein